MKYMGSKNRLSKYLVPIIQDYINKENIDIYIELFVGGANMIDKIKCKNKVGCDNNIYLIELFKNISKIDELPQIVTYEHYCDVRNSYNNKDGKFEDWYIGAIGFLASCNGRFFDGGYAKTTDRNYYDEAKRNLIKQSENLLDIKWYCKDYKEYKGKGNLLYLDPPYKNTKKYNTSRNFPYEEYYDWVRKMSKDNIILCSEQWMPDDFECIWEQEVTRAIGHQDSIKATEKLYTYKNIK